MAEHALLQNLVFANALALRAQTRNLQLRIGREPQDVTTLEDTFRSRLAGLSDVAFSAGGFFDAEEPDATLFTELGLGGTVITVVDGDTLGNTAYFFRALVGQYSPIEAGSIGDPHMFAIEAGASEGALYRGSLMENGTETATGDGTGRQIGAVTAGQSIYLALHVTAITGDWDVVVESDDNGSFTSGTDRITVASLTTVGDSFQSLAGAITDDWWRVHFVENSAGSITLAASLAIA